MKLGGRGGVGGESVVSRCTSAFPRDLDCGLLQCSCFVLVHYLTD